MRIFQTYHTGSAIRVFSPDEDWIQASKELEKKITKFASLKCNKPPNCFGQEIRSSYVLEQISKRKDVYLNRFPRGRRPSIRRFFLRPASEPIACSYAGEFRCSQHSLELVGDLASVLFGRKREVRSNKLTTRPRNGIVTEFPEPSKIKHLWEQRNCRDLLDYKSSLAWALNRYLDFLQIHLFKDGNGRTARSLLIFDMAYALRIELPYIPLGPFTYMYSPLVIRSYVEMMTTNDNKDFYWVMLNIINDSLEFSYRIQAGYV